MGVEEVVNLTPRHPWPSVENSCIIEGQFIQTMKVQQDAFAIDTPKPRIGIVAPAPYGELCPHLRYDLQCCSHISCASELNETGSGQPAGLRPD